MSVSDRTAAGLSDFDALWDHDRPAETERAFRDILRQTEGVADARPYFAKAHERLSQDPWLAEREPQRLQRLRGLAEER